MITITPAACSALAELLDEADVQSHLVLRVVVEPDGKLELSLESPQLEDTVFSFRGRNVMALEPEAAEMLSGTTLHL